MTEHNGTSAEARARRPTERGRRLRGIRAWIACVRGDGGLLTLVAFGGTVVGAHPGTPTSQTIHTCYNANSGESKVAGVGTNSAPCTGGATALDFNAVGPPGPQGATGPAGPAGAQGAPSVSGYQVRSRSLDTDQFHSGAFGGLGCPAGKKPLGGGVSPDSAPAGYAIMSDRPLAPGDFGESNPQGSAITSRWIAPRRSSPSAHASA